MTTEQLVKIMELAWNWADKKGVKSGEEYIEAKTKAFEQAYKAMFKTVGETTLPTKTPTTKMFR